MNQKLKNTGLVIAGFIGFIFLIRVFVGGGYASSCVTTEEFGQFKSYENQCPEPINALVCTEYIIGPEKCNTKTYAANSNILTIGSKDAGVLISVLSPIKTFVAACKVTHQPSRLADEPGKYSCTKI